MTDETQPTPLTADQAKACLQFLQRTQMQGAEMPAYVSIFNSLTAIAGTGDEASMNAPSGVEAAA